MRVSIVPDVFGTTGAPSWLAERVRRAGWEPMVEEGSWTHLPVDAGAEEVEEALDALGTVFALTGLPLSGVVVGVGLGGALALQAGCAVPGIRAVVDVGGRLAVPTLTDLNPIQPLDLLPGLTAPLQFHAGAQDPLVPGRHVARLRERLAPRELVWQICRYPDAGLGFLEPDRPGYDAMTAETAWARIRAFLDHVQRREDAA